MKIISALSSFFNHDEVRNSNFIARYNCTKFAKKFDLLRRYHNQEPIIRAINEIYPLEGARIVEIGAGTGVFSQELVNAGASVIPLDKSPFMLKVFRENFLKENLNLKFSNPLLADHRHIPLPSCWADVVLSSFSLDSIIYDNPEDKWQFEIDNVIREMLRVTKKSGAVIIIATPYGKRDFTGHIERVWGFKRKLIKTLWHFPSKKSAKDALTLFFGKRVWNDYSPNFPKAVVTIAGIWWQN